jgi:hypothetical protein
MWRSERRRFVRSGEAVWQLTGNLEEFDLPEDACRGLGAMDLL